MRVVGGWSEYQFAERRLPTLEEINAAAPDTPVFITNHYDRAFLNKAALHAVGYTRDTPHPWRGEIQKDTHGNPTGLLISQPDPAIIYATLAMAPPLNHDDRVNSTRQFMRELNRFGLTSVIDAGGGQQRYPEDYQIIEELHEAGQLTLRFAYHLFTQAPGREMEDYRSWATAVQPGDGDDSYRLNGVGEMIVYSAYDFENFLQPRPFIPMDADASLTEAITFLVQNRWPFRMYATYDESIKHYLRLFEEINREVPFAGMRWCFDHAETISPESIERVLALGGGITIQHRMAYQGEYFIDRYGRQAAEQTPPVRQMLQMGVPVGAGTDATRVSTYNPWIALTWLTTGLTVGGTRLYFENNRLSREEALRLYTLGSAWFSRDEDKKGALVPGLLADLAVLSNDYFSIPEEKIKRIESLLTIVGGKAVYGVGPFAQRAPPPLPVSPAWSPVGVYGGYRRSASGGVVHGPTHTQHPSRQHHGHLYPRISQGWSLDCDCFSF